MSTQLFSDEGYRFMGAAFEVYNEQGYGLGEELYQESLELELILRCIVYEVKPALTCFYKGRELSKKYYPDLRVANCLIIELKAVAQLLPEHEAQILNYLRISRQPVGYLINFAHKNTLEWKRYIVSDCGA